MHLYIKTVERAHSPKNLWEKIYLSRNYAKAMGQLEEHLAYFPKAQVHRNKQRLTKIHQYLLRMRKLKLREVNGRKASLTRVHRKVEQREERREKKALVAAKIENNIEKELMERLAKGTYGDIYNFPEVPYQKALESMGENEEEMEEEEEEELDTDDEESVEGEMATEYVEDLEEEDEEVSDAVSVLAIDVIECLLVGPYLQIVCIDVASHKRSCSFILSVCTSIPTPQDVEDMEMNAWDDNSSGSDEDESGSSEGESEDEQESGSGSDEDGSGSESSDNSDEDDDDDDDISTPKKKKKPKRKQPPNSKPKRGVRVEIEYEDENEGMLEEEGVAAGGAGLAW